MDIRTIENCQKYREAKQFVELYEKEFISILFYENIDNDIYNERKHIMLTMDRLKEYPDHTHLQLHLERHKEKLINLLKQKYECNNKRN